MALQSSQEENESRMLSIPLEVLLHISSYLSTPEYGNLRLACRRLEAFLFKSFAQEFFAKRQFMLTEFSLGALVDISKSRLGHSLSHLIISVARPPMWSPFRRAEILEDGDVNDLKQAFKYNRMNEEYISHQTLISSGQDVELLTEALRNLPNLRIVGLRDFCSPGRYREGDSHLWNTYGAPTFFRETGSRYEHPLFFHDDQEPANYVCHVMLSILRALGKTKEVHGSLELQAILRTCCVPNIALDIPRYVEPTVSPVLENLRVLFLDLGPNSFSRVVVNNNGHYDNILHFRLAVFLSKTPSLEHLRLNFRECKGDEAKGILQWLANISGIQGTLSTKTQTLGASGMQDRFPKLPPAPEFPRLEKLDIGMVTLAPPLLLGLYKKYKSSLCKISLHKVTFESQPQHVSTVKVNLWSKLFGQILKLNLKLNTIHVSYIRQKYNFCAYLVEFRGPNHDSKKVKYSKEWTGDDLERGSQEFVEEMFINWPDEEMDEDDTSDSDAWYDEMEDNDDAT
ncbi:hypothetical protein F4804DRAFT_333962 [Jackrogersella minutella]|nr:hypothetical protein F4804DRAFT_333962 [Jackrogersella minutella]